MHKRLATEDAKKSVTHFFGLSNDIVHLGDVDLFLLGCDVNPTSLAPQVTAIGNGYIKERWKELALLKTFFMLLYRPNTLEARLVREVP